MTLVSFLMPVRGAAETTLTSLGSIKDNSSDTVPYEILIRYDEDDDTYQDIIPKIYKLFEGTMGKVKIIIGPRYGYEGLHHYYNECAAISRGKLLFLWNDDLQILPVKEGWDVTGHGVDFPLYEKWDLILQQDEANREPHINVLTPTEVYWDLPEPGPDVKYPKQISTMAFPVLTREAYRVMGHFSASPLNDAYLLDISTLKLDGKITRKRSRVMLLHTPEIDETGASLRCRTDSYSVAYDYHYSDRTTNRAEEDREKLIKHWQQNH
tara:strand:- start:20 stop:820 length:801 start_codon:yes stop_codon:yes gene_type:complete